MIRRVAILGAGIVGAQIAAQFANVGIPPLLFDVPALEVDKNALVKQSIQALRDVHPNPLAADWILQKIEPANYESDLDKLRDCDLVIESISECLEWKVDLYAQIVDFINDEACLVTNTSGLSIELLSQSLPEYLKPRFFGMHFFNPPRYMKLVELIPHALTQQSVLDQMETFLVSKLGKGVVYAKNTTNFIGNRIGVFALLLSMHHAAKHDLPLDVVDVLTGPLMGRATSASFRTLDIIGLDSFSHIVRFMQQGLPEDPWHGFFVLPVWLKQLIERGVLGEKTHKGIYLRESDGSISILDLKTLVYRVSHRNVSSEILEILQKKDYTTRFAAIKSSNLPEAKFLWEYHCDLFQYCAYHATEIAHNCHDIDKVMRWGYGWTQGPLETWQLIGWQQMYAWLQEAIDNKQTLSQARLPDWVSDPEALLQPVFAKLPVYKKQFITGGQEKTFHVSNRTVLEQEFVTVKTLDLYPDIGIVFLSEYIGDNVIVALKELRGALTKCQQSCFKALVISNQHGSVFGLGLPSKDLFKTNNSGEYQKANQYIDLLQQVQLDIQALSLPVIAAARGAIQGIGYELILNCDRVFMALESSVGFTDAKEHIVPVGGGILTLLQAAWLKQETSKEAYFKYLGSLLHDMLFVQVSSSALEFQQKLSLQHIHIIPNQNEVLYEACEYLQQQIPISIPVQKCLSASVAGSEGINYLSIRLKELKNNKKISVAQYQVAQCLVTLICGGQVAFGETVDLKVMQQLSKVQFLKLLTLKKAQETTVSDSQEL